MHHWLSQPGLPIGELISLLTAVCFALSVVFFTRAGRRIGSMTLNPIRLAMGFVFLMAYGAVMRGTPLPTDATPSAWGWLTLSGFVGFFLGDMFLFRALLEVGPRLSSLLMSLAPPFTALVGFLFLDERIGVVGLAGMALTVVGIVLTISERKPTSEHTLGSRRGIIFGVLGAVGQAVGLVLSKKGMGSYDAFAATQIRVVGALVAFLLLFFALRRFGKVREALRDRRAMSLAAAGAFVGPFLGVGCSLLAVQYIETGVAASIMATTPLMVIPFAWFEGDRPGIRGVIGTLLAVLGVTLLFLR
ncbi:MAG: drug/metabolite transporter (DMT)-like permease [Polyangiales bacterium]|jgi:drug/metabolite transporter (DMT)-like permease